MSAPMSLVDRFSEWLHRLSTGPVTLVAVIIFFVFAATVLNTIVSPVTASVRMDLSNNNAKRSRDRRDGLASM